MTDTERALDDLAQLIESGGLGGGQQPTRTVVWRTAVAGAVESFQIPWKCVLTRIVGTANTIVSITGRTSYGVGREGLGGGLISAGLGPAQNMGWAGWFPFNQGDVLYAFCASLAVIELNFVIETT